MKVTIRLVDERDSATEITREIIWPEDGDAVDEAMTWEQVQHLTETREAARLDHMKRFVSSIATLAVDIHTTR